MAAFDRLCRLAEEFTPISEFLTVYIEEAHPTDGWAFKDNINVTSHSDVTERLAAAGTLEQLRCPSMALVVDDMSDNCNVAYGGLYERLYIVQNSTVVYQGARGPQGFKLEEVETWLKTYRQMSTVDCVVPESL